MSIFRVLFCWLVFSTYCGANEVRIAVFDAHEEYKQASRSYGLAWRLLEEVSAHAQHSVQGKGDAWARALSQLREGKTDMVFAAVKTPDRSQWAAFSLPLAIDNMRLFTHLDSKTTKLEEVDLQSASVGVTKGSVHEEIAKEMGFENIYNVIDRVDIYRMLMGKRLDYLVFTESIAEYYCVKFHPQRSGPCLKTVDKPLQVSALRLMYLKDNQDIREVMQMFNNCLMALIDDNKVAPIFDEFGFSQQEYQAWLAQVVAEQKLHAVSL